VKLLPTELVGSYAVPGWVWIALERVETQNDLGAVDIAELIDDSVSIAIADQENAGVDVLTDGEMARRDFIQSFYGRLTGVVTQSPSRRFGAAGYDQNPRHEVVGEVTAPNGLGIVDELRRLANASKPTKICVPGPLTLAAPLIIRRESGYRNLKDVVAALAEIVRAELHALVDAGATYIQIDEPRYATRHEEAEALTKLFNDVRRGVRARVGLHLCFGNFKGRSHDRRDYSALFPALLNADADQFNLEFANREYAQIELLRKFQPGPKIGIGVVDVKSYFVETPEQVAEAIRRASVHAPAESLVITPDCGFNHTPRHIAFRKLRALVEGAEIVRRELEG